MMRVYRLLLSGSVPSFQELLTMVMLWYSLRKDPGLYPVLGLCILICLIYTLWMTLHWISPEISCPINCTGKSMSNRVFPRISCIDCHVHWSQTIKKGEWAKQAKTTFSGQCSYGESPSTYNFSGTFRVYSWSSSFQVPHPELKGPWNELDQE